MSDAIRVVIADDQPIIRDGFAAVLDSASDIEVVGRANDGQELVDLAQTLQPDLALVDIRMPRMDGIEAASRISSHVAVIMLTTFDLHDYVTASLAAGARGFLLKDVQATRLLDAVRAVSEGALLLGSTVTDQLMRELATPGRSQENDPKTFGLTRREGEVLALLAEGLSNIEIAERLFIGQETVKSHVSEILRKLELRDRVQAVVFAYREGLTSSASA